MSTNTICNAVASYLEDLTATNAVNVALGTTMEYGRNLFIGIEPATKVDTITLTPYGGSPPNVDRQRQNPSIQIRSNTNTRQKALSVQQSLINLLSMNELNGNGFVRCNQSAPIIGGVSEGGEWIIAFSNYNIKHVKV